MYVSMYYERVIVLKRRNKVRLTSSNDNDIIVFL